MGKWVIYYERHLALLSTLSQHAGEWLPLKALGSVSPTADRQRLSELVEREDVIMREVKTTRGGYRYEYQITSAGERMVKEAQS